MTSSASQAGRLPAALDWIPAPRRPASAAHTHGRHAAPESPIVAIASEHDLVRSGRHAEPVWTRGLSDPTRDEMDWLDRLGFEARQD